MAATYHDVLSPPDLHPAFNLIYRTEADRIAGTNEVNGVTLAASNIGQLAKQLDNNSYWELLTVTPSITWAQISGGVRQPTTADIDIYISTTGSDTTGDGSQSTPYATFDRAFRDVQDKDIRHNVIIHPAAGTYTSFPNFLDLQITPGGRLIIDASGETYPVTAGPFTVATVTGVGAQDIWGNELANDLQVSGAPGWSVDQFYGKYLHFTGGNWQDYVTPVWKNTSDTVRTIYDWHTFQAGDTFNIVTPPVVIDVNHSIHITGRKSSQSIQIEDRPQFAIVGCHFKVAADYDYNAPLFFEELSAVFSFTTFQDKFDTDQYSIPVSIKTVEYNVAGIAAGVLAVDELGEQYTFANHILSMNGALPTAAGIDLFVRDQNTGVAISAFACRRRVFSSGNSGMNYALIGGHSTAFNGSIPQKFGGWESLYEIFIEQIGWSGTALNIQGQVGLELNTVYIEAANLPVSCNNNSYCLATWLKGGTIGNAYALEINRGSQLVIPTVADVTILGTSGAVKFTFDGTTHATWPTTGNFYSKVNSFVVSE
jgi:hypothetical protein